MSTAPPHRSFPVPLRAHSVRAASFRAVPFRAVLPRAGAVGLVVFLLSASPALQADDPAAGHIERLEKEALAKVAEEEYFDADRLYRRLLFATGKRTYEKELRSVDKKLAEQVVEMVAEVEPGSSTWLELLNRAFEFDPKNREIQKLFKGADCTFFNGAWRPESENEALKKADGELTERRGSELGLSEMRTIRHGAFRFFTDVKPGNQQFEKMVKASVAVFEAYWGTMRAFDLRYPIEGLDVVVLTHEKDYAEQTGSDDTVGLYFPSRGAGYFHLSGQEVFQTLLHELVHQFNHKVGYFGETAACLEEGMAEYFGFSKFSRGFTQVEPGGPNPSAQRAVLDVIFDRPHEFEYTKFPAYLHVMDPPHYDFYQQSWAFYTFLVRDPDARLRLALHDYLVGTRDDGPDLGTFFERYDLPPILLERRFKEHWTRVGS